MAKYNEQGLRMVGGTLAQVLCTVATTWTAWYTVGGGSNTQGINTPAQRGAKDIIIYISNVDASNSCSLFLKSEASGGAGYQVYRGTIPAGGWTTVYIPEMLQAEILSYYVATANDIHLTAKGKEIQ